MFNDYYIFLDTAAPAANAASSMVKFRVLYAFEARNPDELSVMPGDIVLVSFTECKVQ